MDSKIQGLWFRILRDGVGIYGGFSGFRVSSTI